MGGCCSGSPIVGEAMRDEVRDAWHMHDTEGRAPTRSLPEFPTHARQHHHYAGSPTSPSCGAFAPRGAEHAALGVLGSAQ